MLHVAQLSSPAAAGAQDARLEQLLEHELFELPPDGVRGVEVRQAVRELSEGAADAIVCRIVVWVLYCIAADDKGVAVVVV